MGIIKLEDDMTKAELLATQNSNNGYNEMIVDDMVDSIPKTGASALVEIWSGSATAGQTITLSENIYNFRMAFVQCQGIGQLAMVPIYPGMTLFRGGGQHTTGTVAYTNPVSGTVVSATQLKIDAASLVNLNTANVSAQTISQLYGMR